MAIVTIIVIASIEKIDTGYTSDNSVYTELFTPPLFNPNIIPSPIICSEFF